MVGQLNVRTAGQLVNKAWGILERLYYYHLELYNFSTNHHIALAKLTTQAWERRRRTLQDLTGSPVEAPAFIAKLASLLAIEESGSLAALEDSFNGLDWTGSPMRRMAPVWDQFSGFEDMGSLDWEMFPAGG